MQSRVGDSLCFSVSLSLHRSVSLTSDIEIVIQQIREDLEELGQARVQVGGDVVLRLREPGGVVREGETGTHGVVDEDHGIVGIPAERETERASESERERERARHEDPETTPNAH